MSNSGAHLSVTVEPRTEDHPRAQLQAWAETIGLPVLRLMGFGSYQRVEISFRPERPDDTIRYLRELAAAATDLADQLEHKAAEAVLSS